METAPESLLRLLLPPHARGQLRQIGTGTGSPGSGRAMLTRAAIGTTNAALSALNV